MRSSCLLCLLLVAAFAQFAFGTESVPHPGGECTETDAGYNYASNTAKTPWVLNELYAVPTGTLDPATWESSQAFAVEFLAHLTGGSTPEAYAQACAAVWGEFFDQTATVIFNAKRDITTTYSELKCTSKIWAVVSTETKQVLDVSDWLAAPSGAFDVTDPDAAVQLKNDLQITLSDLNSQPGAI